MRKIKTPLQSELFDVWDSYLPVNMKRKLIDSWEGVFRAVFLELMPVDKLAERFHETIGRSTKELYSMAGLILLKEFNDWTTEEAYKAYAFNANIHFALGLNPGVKEISIRTIERYQSYIVEDDVAMTIFKDVTDRIIKYCGIEVDKQRVDSTHVFSNMASYGRTKLMGMVIKRFLAQLKRHAESDYNNLPESFLSKYEQSNMNLFGDTVKGEAKRTILRQEIAEDLHYIINFFYENDDHNNRITYKQMQQVFAEQCEIKENKICIKKNPGGDTLQNPTDPDATYDGKKGKGYQVQISETCSKNNEEQIITALIPQTATESDTTALPAVLEQLKENGILPKELTGDSHYGTDGNTLNAKEKGVEIISPVKKGSEKSTPDPEQINISDFKFKDGEEEVIGCPEGHSPLSSEYDKEKDRTITFMSPENCEKCPYLKDCLVKKNRKSKGNYVLYSNPRNVRITARRLNEMTENFKEQYRIRSGIEATNSGIKQRTGMQRLRVRGKPRMFNSIIMKITGWNILRGAVCSKLRKIVRKRCNSGNLTDYLTSLQTANANVMAPKPIFKEFMEFKYKIKIFGIAA
jgi:Transposase DDE domain